MSSTPQSRDVTDISSESGLERLRAGVRTHWDSLSPAEKSVCRLLTSYSAAQLLYANAQELGAASGTSNASVIRTLRRLGYDGLPALKQQIAASFTSDVAPEVRLRDRIGRMGGDFAAIWERVADEARERVEHVRSAGAPEDLERAVEILAGAREAAAYGVGASRIAAEHLTVRLNRIGARARHVDTDGFRLADDLLRLDRGDAVVVFAPGRVLPEVEVLLERARQVGASSVLVTDELADELSDRVDAVLAAPHTPTGMTAEALTGIVVADALVQSVATADADRAVESSHELTALRARLGY
ncbi:MurR/RpiR family transcriptional regulator [Nocardiopsis aegyptia]|uniref:DNA-binding MurR/RpiR family transcriptional regulator n=1 Tax=Nocardiopsis aegyptia TaxID=220378 RepID=A0A7Z0JD70_9ACTN|nr:MurR/RpiR family transcriptional regulator [Nocardiopsis aegyptia]NYJ38011.1 DNA-binding MurR/RpiR family transcriptional regulator [Nocardiopsis aegyptia]